MKSFCDLSAEEVDGVLFSADYLPLESDYIILLGTAPQYAPRRAEIAASLYQRLGGVKIIATGGAVSDKSVTECAVMKETLLKCGVPEAEIIEEPRACDTIQNITCSLTEMCKNTDIMSVKNVTVVSEPFHMRRSLLLARILLPQFIAVNGYTEGVEEQRKIWKKDERLHGCVKTEIEILRGLIAKGRIEDIRI